MRPRLPASSRMRPSTSSRRRARRPQPLLGAGPVLARLRQASRAARGARSASASVSRHLRQRRRRHLARRFALVDRADQRAALAGRSRRALRRACCVPLAPRSSALLQRPIWRVGVGGPRRPALPFRARSPPAAGPRIGVFARQAFRSRPALRRAPRGRGPSGRGRPCDSASHVGKSGSGCQSGLGFAERVARPRRGSARARAPGLLPARSGAGQLRRPPARRWRAASRACMPWPAARRASCRGRPLGLRGRARDGGRLASPAPRLQRSALARASTASASSSASRLFCGEPLRGGGRRIGAADEAVPAPQIALAG